MDPGAGGAGILLGRNCLGSGAYTLIGVAANTSVKVLRLIMGGVL